MRPYLIVKRILDFFFAFVLLIILFPLMLLVAIAIKLDSAGPVIFKQKRPGKNAKIFTIYKFRTMCIEREKDEKVLQDFERITRVGSFLRKTSIDELPQLFNVIKGEMSFVGPRPLLVKYLPYYTAEEFRRHEVLPGITGWAQINGRNTTTWEKRFKYDVWYVDNRSILIDIKILLLTIYRVLKREGINYCPDDTMPFFRGNVKKFIL